ncbi:hypothetical protein OROMI_021023 [Orobanche minor]
MHPLFHTEKSHSEKTKNISTAGSVEIPKESADSQIKDVSNNPQNLAVQSRSAKSSSTDEASGSETQKTVNKDDLAKATALDLGRFLFPEAVVLAVTSSVPKINEGVPVNGVPLKNLVEELPRLLDLVLLCQTRMSEIWCAKPSAQNHTPIVGEGTYSGPVVKEKVSVGKNLANHPSQVSVNDLRDALSPEMLARFPEVVWKEAAVIMGEILKNSPSGAPPQKGSSSGSSKDVTPVPVAEPSVSFVDAVKRNKTADSAGRLPDNPVSVEVKDPDSPLGEVNVLGSPMRLFKWDPKFNFKYEPAAAPVWVKIYDLPIQWFDIRALQTVGSLLGSFIKADINTLNRSMLNFARICVELNLKEPRHFSVGIEFDGVLTELTVEYEKIPSYCHHCHHMGHDIDACYFKNPDLKLKSFVNKFQKTSVEKGKEKVNNADIEWNVVTKTNGATSSKRSTHYEKRTVQNEPNETIIVDDNSKSTDDLEVVVPAGNSKENDDKEPDALGQTSNMFLILDTNNDLDAILGKNCNLNKSNGASVSNQDGQRKTASKTGDLPVKGSASSLPLVIYYEPPPHNNPPPLSVVFNCGVSNLNPTPTLPEAVKRVMPGRDLLSPDLGQAQSRDPPSKLCRNYIISTEDNSKNVQDCSTKKYIEVENSDPSRDTNSASSESWGDTGSDLDDPIDSRVDDFSEGIMMLFWRSLGQNF